MRIEDIAKHDWKQDKDLLAAEARMANILDRETATRARLATLSEIVMEDEKLLVQARAAVLLDEESDESEDVVHHRLVSSRQEICDLQASLEAFDIAKRKLEPLVTAAATEARKRVGQELVVPYQETAAELETLLEKAAGLNRILHAIHLHASKQNMRVEIFGNPRLKPLGLGAAFAFLSQPNGQDSLEFATWKKHNGKIFGN